MSYSDRTKMNVRRTERLKRKVLEITLESDDDSYVKVEESDVARLVTRLGIDTASHLEGYQICPGNSKKILLWMKESCNLDRFCKDECFRVSNTVKTGMIRALDRREVVVTIKGLSFNTPDTLVIEYLKKHGKVTNEKEKVHSGVSKMVTDNTRSISLLV